MSATSDYKTFLVLGILSSEQLQEIAAVKRNLPKVLVTGNKSREFTEKNFASCLDNLTLQIV